MAGATIDTREELVNALTEAAELEHGLLCQYLFAAFTMKKHPDEGVTWAQAELIRGWAGVIFGVARQEMAHLAIVTNMLTAIGGAPQFQRPNYPIPAPYYPSGVEFTLQRFSAAALDRFLQFEEPHVVPDVIPESVAPDPLAFVRIGDLYRQIQDAFRTIDGLFIGRTSAQDSDGWSAGLAVRPVTNRASAVSAINAIIVEGEGSPAVPDNDENSHFASFDRIKDALAAEVKDDPDFDPARPVVDNPLSRAHRTAPASGTVLTDPDTIAIAELFNASYGTMLLMLMQFYSFGGENDRQRPLLQATIRQIMSAVVRPLGELLTTMPAGPEFPGRTAGPGFEFYADMRVPTSTRSAWTVIRERLSHEATHAERLVQALGAPARLAMVHENLFVLARNIAAVRPQELPDA